MAIYTDVLVAMPRISRELPTNLQKWLDSTNFDVEIVMNLPQEVARSILISKMYNGGYKYIFMIDSDMTPEDIDLDTTIATMYSHNLSVISCLTSTRGKQQKLLLFKKHSTITYPELDERLYRPGELVQVYAVGFGGCLIKKSVFDKIGLPWFRTNWNYIIPETNEHRIVGGTGMGADFFFSMRCNAEGISMFIDCDNLLHHQELHPKVSHYGLKCPDEYTMNRINKMIGIEV